MLSRKRCDFHEPTCEIIQRPFPFDDDDQRRFICITHRTFHLCNGGQSCVPVECPDEGSYCAKTRLSLKEDLRHGETNFYYTVPDYRSAATTGKKKKPGDTGGGCGGDDEQDRLLSVFRAKLGETVTRKFTDVQIIEMHNMLVKIHAQFPATTDYETLTRLIIYTLEATCYLDQNQVKKDYFGNSLKKRRTIRCNKRLQMIYRVIKNHKLAFLSEKK